jgi:hypothetical protein
MNDPNRYLYHYTKTSTAIDHILKDRRLRLGRYAAMDDPAESKAWEFERVGSTNAVLKEFEKEDLSSWISNELQTRTRVICFCMDSPDLTGDHIRDISLRGFCKPRMWTQYCGSHSGVCLVLDRHKLEESVNRLFPKSSAMSPVEYINRSFVRRLDEQEHTVNLDHLKKVGRETYVRDHRFTHYKRLFFEKMTDWRNEDEFRVIVFDEEEPDLYLPIDDSLTGIMFGERTPVPQIRAMMDMTKDWGLEYGGLKWKNVSPWYDLVRYVPGIEKTGWGKRMWEG